MQEPHPQATESEYLSSRAQHLYVLKAPQMMLKGTELQTSGLHNRLEKVATLPSGGAFLHCTLLAGSLFLSNPPPSLLRPQATRERCPAIRKQS